MTLDIAYYSMWSKIICFEITDHQTKSKRNTSEKRMNQTPYEKKDFENSIANFDLFIQFEIEIKVWTIRKRQLLLSQYMHMISVLL
jgi:hypothetical protein